MTVLIVYTMTVLIVHVHTMTAAHDIHLIALIQNCVQFTCRKEMVISMDCKYNTIFNTNAFAYRNTASCYTLLFRYNVKQLFV